MKKIKIEKIWTDRRRRMGLPLSFTIYSLSEDRLFQQTGFVNIHDEEVLLYRVTDISLRRGLMQRLFGVGTVTVVSSDKTTPRMELKNIKDPTSVKELIHSQVEKVKMARNVRMSEVVGGDDHECCHDHSSEGLL